jgi:hypothetical protein
MHQTDDGRRTKVKTKAHMAKGTKIIYKARYRKIKIEEHEPQWNLGSTEVIRKGKKFLLH